MGSLYGAYLAKAGKTVWLIATQAEHIDEINKHGIAVVHKGNKEFIPVQGTTKPEEAGVCDFIIIATKYKDTHAALKNAQALIGTNTSILTLQNGLGNTELISDFFESDKISAGITTMGAIKNKPGEIEVSHLENATTYLWPLNGTPSQDLQKLVTAFRTSGLDFYLSADTTTKIWNKLALNCSISTLTAIVRLNASKLSAQASAWEIVEALVKEIALVASKEKINLDADTIVTELKEISRNSDHTPSILVDILNQRETEIECLSGAIVRKGKLHNIDVPVNNTIYKLISVLQNTYGDRL